MIMSDTYDDGRKPPVPIGPSQLPEPDPRIRDGFGRQPVTEPAPAQDRHPQTGQFR
jgi:hypothetical protein